MKKLPNKSRLEKKTQKTCFYNPAQCVIISQDLAVFAADLVQL